MIELIKQIIEQDGLAQKNRKAEIIHKRVYLFNTLRKQGYTLKGIGSLFRMNHATILHGLKNYKNLDETKNKLFNHNTEYYKLLLSLERPELDLRKEIVEAKNLVDLRKIQARIKIIFINSCLFNNNYYICDMVRSHVIEQKNY